ncbi:Triacylglycerol lipase 1 [Linum perenne]
MMNLILLLASILLQFLVAAGDESTTVRLRTPKGNLCGQIETTDGYLLALQRVSSRNGNISLNRGPPVLLQHGLFMVNFLKAHLELMFDMVELEFLIGWYERFELVELGDYGFLIHSSSRCFKDTFKRGGDCWFLNSPEESLGFILADQGFDVWVGNVRGTFWSHGHVSLSEDDKEFWDWSWQELAMYDLAEMIHHIYSATSSKVFLVGHSQGTIMSLAALSQPKIVEMVEAAALLCPISYLDHVTAPLVHKMVTMHVDQMITAMGIHQLNFRSEFLINLLDSLCEGLLHCDDLLSSITGDNCCFNSSRIDFYLDYEPHPSSSKNLRHLFQMIRKGTFAQYDYGKLKNLKQYGQASPPVFDLSLIPDSLPLWMGYGGLDGLADIDDMQHTLKELLCKTELLYLENYGHIDFLLSVKAKEDVYDHILAFFGSIRGSRSSA